MADRQRDVVIGPRSKRIGHEHLARDTFDGGEHIAVADAVPAQRHDQLDSLLFEAHGNA